MRARRLVKQLETCGPGDEAPTVQGLLRVGPEALDIVVDAFPGLLWFNRQLPYTAVPRGRDVSPVSGQEHGDPERASKKDRQEAAKRYRGWWKRARTS